MKTLIPAERLTACTLCKGEGSLAVSPCKRLRCWLCSGTGFFYVGDFKPARSLCNCSPRTRRTLDALGVRS